MDWKVVLLLAFVLCGCVTKKKTVDVSKSQTEASGQIVEQSSGNSAVSSSSSKSGITAYDFTELMGKWSLGFDGEMGDSFRFYMNETETGWEAGAEGKGTATAENETKQIQSHLEVNWQEKLDSFANHAESRFAEYEQRIEQVERLKSIDKQSTGLQAGAYIVGALLLAFIILLFLLGWRLRKLGQSVQAFMSFKNLLKDD